MRRIAIGEEAADEIEQEVTNLIAEDSLDRADLRRFLKRYGAPAAIANALYERIRTLYDSINLVEGGNAFGDRSAFEGVVDDYRSIDSLLNKTFRVTKGRRGKPREFNVG